MRTLVFLICLLLKPLVHGDVFDFEQPGPSRIPMSLHHKATGTYGLVNQGKQPTLNSLAKNYGGSEYERQVIVDAAKDAAISAMTWGAITGTLNLVSKTVSTYVAKKAFKEMLAGDVVSSHVKFKTPGTASNSNFMQAINRNVMSVEKTGTYGSYGLLNQGKQPTLNSLAKNYGGSESNAFFKPMMSKDTLNNQIGGSQLGSVSEHQTFNQIGSKEVSQSFNKPELRLRIDFTIGSY